MQTQIFKNFNVNVLKSQINKTSHLIIYFLNSQVDPKKIIFCMTFYLFEHKNIRRY